MANNIKRSRRKLGACHYTDLNFDGLTQPKSLDLSKVLLNQTRRILKGNEVGDTRPYMVYLRPSPAADKILKERNWLCGGVIISAQFVLTSAACIEEIQHFYVISGTHSWLPLGNEDECIKNGAKKAVWKCVPKDYVFDGKEFENIRWMVNDIAVVKVEDDFNFERRIRGCDFAPKLISYNNQSEDLEAPGTSASIAGWGSIDRFGDMFGRSTMNSPELLETDVILISKKKCKARWPERYHYIIDGNMVCAKDEVETDSMSAVCREHEINCKELVYSNENDNEDHRRYIPKPNMFRVHSANHFYDSRRAKTASGGFCENDHGGPLVVGHGKGSVVIGVISACMSANFTQQCYGPFLYTSVWRNRHVISCAIDKDKGASCRKLLRSLRTPLVETKFNWRSHPDGPAKNEDSKKRQMTTTKKQIKLKILRQTTTTKTPIKTSTTILKRTK